MDHIPSTALNGPHRPHPQPRKRNATAAAHPPMTIIRPSASTAAALPARRLGMRGAGTSQRDVWEQKKCGDLSSFCQEKYKCLYKYIYKYIGNKNGKFSKKKAGKYGAQRALNWKVKQRISLRSPDHGELANKRYGSTVQK